MRSTWWTMLVVRSPSSNASHLTSCCSMSIFLSSTASRFISAFSIKIPEQDMWRGSIDASSPESIADGVARLRARMPAYAWDKLPSKLQPQDLPRLITVQTIVDYVEARLGAPDARADAS